MARIKQPQAPKGERIWVRYLNTKDELLFYMTTKKDSRDIYCLYEVRGSELKKLGKAKTPLELEEKHKVYQRMRE